jgi:hypothetical protein
MVDPMDNVASGGPVTWVAAPMRTGKALAIHVAWTGGNESVTIPLCSGPSDTADLSGFSHISADVFIQPDPGNTTNQTRFSFHWFKASPVDQYDYAESELFFPAVGQWTTITGSVPLSFSNNFSKINLDPAVAGPTSWFGTIYLDNVQLVK